MLQAESLSFQGQTIHFATERPTSRPEGCALLISGVGENLSCWRRIVPELIAAKIFCAVSELPGLGGKARENRNENRAGILWGVLDELDKRAGRLRTWHIIAHGSSCAAALMMAHMQPESVASLVLICPVFDMPVSSITRRMLKGKYADAMCDIWYSRNIVDGRRFADLAVRIYGARPNEMLLREMRAPLLKRRFANSLVYILLEGYRLPEAAYTPQCPTMVLHGGRDRYARYGARTVHGAETHTLRDAAHCPAETHFPAVCDYLRGWYRAFL